MHRQRFLFRLFRALHPPHRHTQLSYAPASLLPTLHRQLLFSRPSPGRVFQAHPKQLVSAPPIWILRHSSKETHRAPNTLHIHTYSSNEPCEVRRNVFLDQTIACDVPSTFCRLLHISLAGLSAGSPAHYRMLITSSQVT